jgi:hypothetical protein
MQTITIDLINSRAIKLLEELQELELIRIHQQEAEKKSSPFEDFRGVLAPRPMEEVEEEFKKVRSEWDHRDI